MRFKNTTDYSDKFLRRMLSWCCKELDMPIRKTVRSVSFANTKNAWSGCAWYSGKIAIRIGSEKHFPYRPFYYRTNEPNWLNTRLQALVIVTSHEIAHLRQTQSPALRQQHGKRVACREKHAQRLALNVLIVFLPLESELTQHWQK